MKIIFDTDPGVDDAMALLLALRCPELDVIGVTTVFGNSNIEVTTRNALNLLDVAHRRDIPVAKGAGRPLIQPPHPTGEWVHGDDAMGNIGWAVINNPLMKPVDMSAAQFIVQQVMDHAGEPGAPLTLVPVGPLTNIALALKIEPRIADHARVVMMGGAVREGGNVSPLAEANIWNDPHAASIVLSADWEVTMAGLDVTHAVRMNNDYFASLSASGDPLAEFVAQVARFYQGFHEMRYGFKDGTVFTHDPTAIMYLIAPELFKVERYSLCVPVDGPAIGATIADRSGGRFYTTPKVNCLMGVDEPRFLQIYRERMTREGKL
jgi:uridine nucleosidase